MKEPWTFSSSRVSSGTIVFDRQKGLKNEKLRKIVAHIPFQTGIALWRNSATADPLPLVGVKKQGGRTDKLLAKGDDRASSDWGIDLSGRGRLIAGRTWGIC